MHIRAGFRAVFRTPTLALGEIAWRWAFGTAAWTLVIVALHRILARVDITEAERLIARRSDMFLIADACSRILAQVLPQFARECVVLAPAIAVLWIAASTLGRAITLQTLLSTSESKDRHFGPLLRLQFLRSVFTLATVIALFGAMLLVGAAFPARDPTTAIAVGMCLAALVGFIWSVVNWFLALAPIWIVRDGRRALKSVAESIDFYRRIPGPYMAIATWFGLFRGMALVIAVIAALVVTQATPTTAVALSVVIALVYFAIADFLYMARLAAFVALDETCKRSSQFSAIGSPPAAPAAETFPSPGV